MQPHGKARISPDRPRALGVCQRCGFLYNHDTLRWQYQFGGLKLINLRILVCDTCYDTPQPQKRTLVLPPDPVPIQFAVPEDYTTTDNPNSPIGYSARANFDRDQLFGANIGTLTQGGGLNAAFDGYTGQSALVSSAPVTFVQKLSRYCASVSVSGSSFTNFIGKNWNAPLNGTPAILQNTVSYNVSSFSVYASFDQPIIPIVVTTLNNGATFNSGAFDPGTFDTVQGTFTTNVTGNIQLQGSNDGVNWTVLYSSTIQGVAGEVFTSLSSNLTTGNYQEHRVAIAGDGVRPIYVAQVQFNVSNTGQNEQ